MGFCEGGNCCLNFGLGQRRQKGNWPRRSRQGCKVTDIFTWLQCFGTSVAVLAPHEPHTVPELMVYMGIIVRVSQDYEGLGWVRYDSAFNGKLFSRAIKMVSRQRNSVHDELFWQGGRNEAVRVMLRNFTQREGACPEWQSGS